MKAAYKWRLQNGIYGYIVDETDSDKGPFIYDVAHNTRTYSSVTIAESTVNDGAIATVVSKLTKQAYITRFETFKSFVLSKYPQVSFLDVIYYYNVEGDECSTSASSLKCAATDIFFDVASVEIGEPDEASVTIEAVNSNTENGEPLQYNLSFVIPQGPQGEQGPVPNIEATASATTVDASQNATATVVRDPSSPDTDPVFNFGFEIPRGEGVDANGNLTANTISAKTIISETVTANTISATTIISETFVKSGGTSVQYLMADGSVTTLTAGTNVTITKDNTTGVVTISAYDSDTNTWRPVKVNGNNFLGSGIDTKALNLSAGTNVTLNTNTDGTITISANDTDSNTWRKIQLNGNDILGTGTNTNPLNLSAGTNVTLTNNNGTVTISSDDTNTDTKVYQEKKSTTLPGELEYHPMVLGYCSGSTSAVTVTNVTEQVFVDPKIVVNSSTHTLYTQRIINEYSITTGTLTVKSGITANSINITGSTANIVPNLPTYGKFDYNNLPPVSSDDWYWIYFSTIQEMVYIPKKVFNYIDVDTTSGQQDTFFALPTSMYPKNSVVILIQKTHYIATASGDYNARFLSGVNVEVPSFYTVKVGETQTVRRVTILYLSDQTFTYNNTEFTKVNDHVAVREWGL